MATYNINIPGDTGVDMNEGDTLTITFISAAKFCISSGNASDFNPSLPVGTPESQGYVWSGVAQVPNATIHYSHVGHNGTCGAPNPRNTIPGTIQIGTTPKP
jgi:hypothetical protein